MGTPSQAQLLVRSKFKASCDCFMQQPDSGGAEPSGIGPYSRAWWYTSSFPSGLFYYNFFMQATLDYYFSNGSAPLWCSETHSWINGKCSTGTDNEVVENVDYITFGACQNELGPYTKRCTWFVFPDVERPLNPKYRGLYLYAWCRDIYNSPLHIRSYIALNSYVFNPVTERLPLVGPACGEITVVSSGGWKVFDLSGYIDYLNDPNYVNYGCVLLDVNYVYGRSRYAEFRSINYPDGTPPYFLLTY